MPGSVLWKALHANPAGTYPTMMHWSRPAQPAALLPPVLPSGRGGIGGTVASVSALRSAATLPSRVRVLPSAPRPD
ncbi:hypothetical protein PoB_007035900 [Plakobranchus ocellatus]|uniref:Uncharacterized protein n=1 Tax=Plakobranchus ocellatus TaxID=259542 RepID=A0AAV4DI48_9GAST|nr:hypothetical protein PoB_007035900 [Plakobranchus ocellatus]